MYGAGDGWPGWLPRDPETPIDVPGLPYLERQAVLVVTPTEVQATRRALIETLTPSRPSISVSIGMPRQEGWVGIQLATARAMGLIKPWSSVMVFSGWAPTILAAYRAWRRTKVAALVISTDEAQQLRWPHGGPTKYELYIGSPADPRTYYPTASFHEDVLFERYGELRELLSRLGATRIATSVSRGRRIDGSIQAGLDAPNLPADVGLSGGIASAQHASREDLREMDSGSLPARDQLDAGLHWYARERDWQRLADLCYAGRAKRERIFFRQNTDYGLNANFEAAIKKLPVSVEIGGRYAKHVETVWEVEAEFSSSGRAAVTD
jgi:hypothetical protein